MVISGNIKLGVATRIAKIEDPVVREKKIAAIVYDMAARKHFGEFACANLPDSNYLTPESITV
jgi:hypothetical protein